MSETVSELLAKLVGPAGVAHIDDRNHFMLEDPPCGHEQGPRRVYVCATCGWTNA